MFRVCGITGISKIEFFNFSGIERVNKSSKSFIHDFVLTTISEFVIQQHFGNYLRKWYIKYFSR